MILKEFFSHANWLAILVAAIAYFALGAMWYSALFGKQWMAGNKIPEPTPEMREQMKKQMPLMMIKTLLMNIVMALAIGILAYALQSSMCMSGIKLGLLLSAVGVVPILMSHLYLMKPLKIWVIDGAYHLVGITVMSIIISVWHHH